MQADRAGFKARPVPRFKADPRFTLQGREFWHNRLCDFDTKSQNMARRFAPGALARNFEQIVR